MRSAEQCILAVERLLTKARVAKNDKLVVQLDLFKAYNLMDPVLAVEILRDWGLDPAVCELLIQQYGQLDIRHRFAKGQCGE
eukprot:5534374-Amphidinium_carterae.2